MRICILGNIPLLRVKDAFIRCGHAIYECGDVHQWTRDVEDRGSFIYEFSPEAFLVVFDVGYSELTMISLDERKELVAKLRGLFSQVPVVVPYLPYLSESVGVMDFYDIREFKTGNEPFTNVGVEAIVKEFENSVNVHPCKALVIADDCTLWDGRLRDQQFKGVGRNSGFAKNLRYFMEAGVPVALVSHNDENEVARTLTRWGMGVKYEYFTILSCGHRTIKSGIDDVCARLNLCPDELVFVSGMIEDRALAQSFFPQMVVPTSRQEVNLNEYLRDVVTRCFPLYSVGIRRVEDDVDYVNRREMDTRKRWGRTIQQFRDKFMPIALHATKRKRKESLDDIERLRARAELRTVNFHLTRTESELVPVLWWTDFRAWYITATVGRYNSRVFMASVVVGINGGKVKVIDFLMNEKFKGYSVENAIMNYVREQLLLEGLELIGFEAGYGFDETPFAVEIKKALAAGYGYDLSVPELPTYCKWIRA